MESISFYLLHAFFFLLLCFPTLPCFMIYLLSLLYFTCINLFNLLNNVSSLYFAYICMCFFSLFIVVMLLMSRGESKRSVSPYLGCLPGWLWLSQIIIKSTKYLPTQVCKSCYVLLGLFLSLVCGLHLPRYGRFFFTKHVLIVGFLRKSIRVTKWVFGIINDYQFLSL